MGDEKNKSLEIIGFDESNKTDPMHYFDNHGNSGTMQASYHNRVWTFLGDSLRFTGSFRDDGKILSGTWEQSVDGSDWKHFMDIKLTKVN